MYSGLWKSCFEHNGTYITVSCYVKFQWPGEVVMYMSDGVLAISMRLVTVCDLLGLITGQGQIGEINILKA